MSVPGEPSLPATPRAWAAWLIALVVGGFLGFFAHLWIHRLVHAF